MKSILVYWSLLVSQTSQSMEVPQNCSGMLGYLAQNMHHEAKHPVTFMRHHSAHTITDLGDQLRCDGNTSMVDAYNISTRYSFLSLNVTALPVQVFIGLCLPEVCTQAELSDVAAKVTGLTNGLLAEFDEKMPKGLDIFGINVVRANYTRMQMKIVQPQEEL